jgi:glycine hydroxymethyltransferase
MLQGLEVGYLNKYLAKASGEKLSSAAIAYLASLDVVHNSFPLIADAIVKELKDQRSNLKMIASENYSSLAVQLAMGNLLTDKYSEGFAKHRFYAGCDNVDVIEEQAVELAKKLFGADHAYVQPHSGCDANLVAFWAILVERIQTPAFKALVKKFEGTDRKLKTLDDLTAVEYEEIRQLMVNQKIMGLALGSGGHLTHGFRQNISSKMMQAVSYDVDPLSGLIDYEALAIQVKKEKPLILIAGYSAYSRLIDFARMREIADSVGAVFMVDMAHFAGLVGGKVMQGNYDPIPHAHMVTSTTHKTLRGPRGGLVLCKAEFADAVNKGCPMVLGGPLPHVMAAKAIAFKEAVDPAFSVYAHKIVENARALSAGLMSHGVRVLTGGTDNHLLVMDVASTFKINGRMAESLLREAGITVNRNSIPRDPKGAWYTSGVRMGTPAMTTIGMGESEMKEIASIIYDLLKDANVKIDEKTSLPSLAKAKVPDATMVRARKRVNDVLRHFPLYPELVID